MFGLDEGSTALGALYLAWPSASTQSWILSTFECEVYGARVSWRNRLVLARACLFVTCYKIVTYVCFLRFELLDLRFSGNIKPLVVVMFIGDITAFVSISCNLELCLSRNYGANYSQGICWAFNTKESPFSGLGAEKRNGTGPVELGFGFQAGNRHG